MTKHRQQQNMDQPDWKRDIDLSKNTGYIQIYTDQNLKEKLEKHAEKNGKPLSSYLEMKLMLILRLEEETKNSTETFVQESINGESTTSKEKIEQLEKQLELERSKTTIDLSFDEQQLEENILTNRFKTFEEIKAEIAKQGLLDEAVLKPLENQLWKLSASGKAEYDRVHGWRLKEDE